MNIRLERINERLNEMDINKKIISMIDHVSREERDQLMRLLDCNQHEGNTKLILAIFRDVYMFKEMSQALLMRYQGTIKELEKRVSELEDKAMSE